ncbi:MauE/DoxX family redox-associated membrane protein [Nonomuraea wenchangensis]
MDLVIRIMLSAVFVISAVGKIRTAEAWHGFRSSVDALDMIPPRLARAAALAVVALEVVVAMSLAVPALSTAGLAGSAALLMLFSAVIVQAMRAGRGVECRCFGRSDRPMGVPHLLRNAFLLLITACGAAVSSARAPYSAELLVVGAPVGVAGAVLVASFVELCSLFENSSPVSLKGRRR